MIFFIFVKLYHTILENYYLQIVEINLVSFKKSEK